MPWCHEINFKTDVQNVETLSPGDFNVILFLRGKMLSSKNVLHKLTNRKDDFISITAILQTEQIQRIIYLYRII